MGKTILGSTCKTCRRIGESVCGKQKCALVRRPTAPGRPAGARPPRLTEYGIQLREKQKAKALFGVMEKQFRHYYEAASNKHGNTGQELLQLLEARLDNAVYRAGYAETRSQARQMVSHGHFTLNGRRVDIPSIEVKPGDVFEIREKSKKSPLFADLAKTLASHNVPKWLSIDKSTFVTSVQGTPDSEDVEQQITVNLIVEFYSR